MIANMPDGGLLVAVDGPSGTGKSSTCRVLAEKLGANYLDTGAMYRVATLQVLRRGIAPHDSAAVIEATRDLPLAMSEDPHSTEVLLDGEDVAQQIRSRGVTNAVSAVAAIPEVRENLVALQRSLAYGAKRVVVEGRDIGTQVLPEAPIKIYLTAAAEVRAQRRYDQDLAAGRTVDYATVLADVQRRDAADANREVSPSRPADDAQIVDTSQLSFDQVVDLVYALVVQSAAKATKEDNNRD